MASQGKGLGLLIGIFTFRSVGFLDFDLFAQFLPVNAPPSAKPVSASTTNDAYADPSPCSKQVQDL
jgi:hypothetical protein